MAAKQVFVARFKHAFWADSTVHTLPIPLLTDVQNRKIAKILRVETTFSFSDYGSFGPGHATLWALSSDLDTAEMGLDNEDTAIGYALACGLYGDGNSLMTNNTFIYDPYVPIATAKTELYSKSYAVDAIATITGRIFYEVVTVSASDLVGLLA